MPVDDGWNWFGGTGTDDRDADTDDAGLALTFARCFRGTDGERVLAHLRALTVERVLGPSATDAQLRHAEGQRQLVFHILSLIERGRNGE